MALKLLLFTLVASTSGLKLTSIGKPSKGKSASTAAVSPDSHFNVFHNVCVEPSKNSASLIHSSPNSVFEPAPHAEFGTWAGSPKHYSGGMLWNLPGKKMSQAEWDEASAGEGVEPATMLFSIPNNNPNHEFYDGLLSLYPTFDSEDAFTQVWLPQDPDCRTHGCLWAKTFYDVKGKQHVKFLDAKSTRCFEKVYVPRLSYYRPRAKGTLAVVPSHNVSVLIRDQLTSKFGKFPEKYALLYGHEDGVARRWQNIGEVNMFLQNRGHKTRYLKRFTELSLDEQCQAVWHADVIVMPHGGQEGNLVCARAGTKIISASCSKNVEWIRLAPDFREAMGLQYMYHVPETCGKKSKGRENFPLPTEQVEAWITNPTK